MAADRSRKLVRLGLWTVALSIPIYLALMTMLVLAIMLAIAF